jgi:hypothetical protein
METRVSRSEDKSNNEIHGLADEVGCNQHNFSLGFIHSLPFSSWFMLYLNHLQEVGDGCVWEKGVRKLTKPITQLAIMRKIIFLSI